jgi:hypothetical protein
MYMRGEGGQTRQKKKRVPHSEPRELFVYKLGSHTRALDGHFQVHSTKLPDWTNGTPPWGQPALPHQTAWGHSFLREILSTKFEQKGEKFLRHLARDGFRIEQKKKNEFLFFFVGRRRTPWKPRRTARSLAERENILRIRNSRRTERTNSWFENVWERQALDVMNLN